MLREFVSVFVNKVRQVWEIEAEGLLLTEPFLCRALVFVGDVPLVLKINTLVDELIPNRLSKSSDIPVGEDRLLWLGGHGAGVASRLLCHELRNRLLQFHDIGLLFLDLALQGGDFGLFA